MAGHSHAKNVQYKKNAQDRKRSMLFTRIQREIYIAVRQGVPDDKFNPRLRLAKQKARFYNMPNDKISSAIKRATDAESGGDNYEECHYLISSSNGVFILVEALTDNKNRSASDIRGIAAKYGKSIAEPSTIDFIFASVGVIKYDANSHIFDDIFEKAVMCGAISVENIEYVQSTDDDSVVHKMIEILCDFKDLNTIRNTLQDVFGEAKVAEHEFRAKNKLYLPEDEKLRNFIETLEELDDVSAIYTNYEVIK